MCALSGCRENGIHLRRERLDLSAIIFAQRLERAAKSSAKRNNDSSPGGMAAVTAG